MLVYVVRKNQHVHIYHVIQWQVVSLHGALNVCLSIIYQKYDHPCDNRKVNIPMFYFTNGCCLGMDVKIFYGLLPIYFRGLPEVTRGNWQTFSMMIMRLTL